MSSYPDDGLFLLVVMNALGRVASRMDEATDLDAHFVTSCGFGVVRFLMPVFDAQESQSRVSVHIFYVIYLVCMVALLLRIVDRDGKPSLDSPSRKKKCNLAIVPLCENTLGPLKKIE